MRVGSLFSGCGGLDVAVHAALGLEPAWLCEREKHPRTVLARHWPGTPIVSDVREIDDTFVFADVLYGGYPCQPFSTAGMQRGAADERDMWPEFFRCIRVLRPRLVILENVSGHLGFGFDRTLADLASIGFSCRWGLLRAADVGAPHRRARLFAVAYPSGIRAGRNGGTVPGTEEPGRPDTFDPDPPELRGDVAADPDSGGWESGGEPAEPWLESEAGGELDRCDHTQWGEFQPAIRRWQRITGVPAPKPTDDRGRLMPEFVEWMLGLPIGWTEGIPRRPRLTMLGNAVVPLQGATAIRLLA